MEIERFEVPHGAGKVEIERFDVSVSAEDVIAIRAQIAESRRRRAEKNRAQRARGPEKVRENRLRRMARRQGFELHKSRVRDPWGIDYGTYWLIDPTVPTVVFGRIPGDFVLDAADLDDIEWFLTQGEDEVPQAG